MSFIKVPKALLVTGSIDAYSDAGEARKLAFHKEGKAFLKKLDAELNPNKEDGVSIRSNMGGIAVSGEVTMHSDHLYVQLSQSCMGPGVQMMFRSCDSQKDYSGHNNNFTSMNVFADEESQERVLRQMRSLIDVEKAHKQDHADVAIAHERPRG